MFLALAGRFLYQRDTREGPRLILYDHVMTTVILRLSRDNIRRGKNNQSLSFYLSVMVTSLGHFPWYIITKLLTVINYFIIWFAVELKS